MYWLLSSTRAPFVPLQLSLATLGSIQDLLLVDMRRPELANLAYLFFVSLRFRST